MVIVVTLFAVAVITIAVLSKQRSAELLGPDEASAWSPKLQPPH